VSEVEKWIKEVAAYPHQVKYDLKDQSGSVQILVTDELDVTSSSRPCAPVPTGIASAVSIIFLLRHFTQFLYPK